MTTAMAIHLLVPHVLDFVHNRRVAAVLVAHGLSVAHGLDVEGLLAVRVEHGEARGMACHSAIV